MKPSIRNVALKYAKSGSLNPGTGTFASTSFRLTSLYDVDYTDAGKAVPGFAQYAAFFQKHVVTHAKITCNIWSNSSSNPGFLVAGLQLNEGSSAASDIDTLLTDPRTAHVFIGGTYGGAGMRSWTQTYDPVKLFGVSKKALLSYAPLVTETNANPSDNFFCTLHVAGIDTASDTAACFYTVVLEFLVDFKEPKLVLEA